MIFYEMKSATGVRKICGYQHNENRTIYVEGVFGSPLNITVINETDDDCRRTVDARKAEGYTYTPNNFDLEKGLYTPKLNLDITAMKAAEHLFLVQLGFGELIRHGTDIPTMSW